MGLDSTETRSDTISGRALAARAVLAALWLCSCGAVASAAPLDLADATPRWVEVRFEVSPEDEPGRLDETWSGARSAYLEPDVDEGIVRIRIPADEVEAHLRSTGTEAIPGSFSEFVWTLDPTTGHVLEAQLEGSVRERFRVGPIHSAATVRIQVAMTTRHAGGFRSKGVLGVRTHQYCAPEARETGCVPVDPVRYDPERGYVNAVGTVRAASAIFEIQAFSPLGEVRFSERPGQPDSAGNGTRPLLSGTSGQDAVCSSKVGGPCGADHGGES